MFQLFKIVGSRQVAIQAVIFGKQSEFQALRVDAELVLTKFNNVAAIFKDVQLVTQ